jgi:hypothetical protein
MDIEKRKKELEKLAGEVLREMKSDLAVWAIDPAPTNGQIWDIVFMNKDGMPFEPRISIDRHKCSTDALIKEEIRRKLKRATHSLRRRYGNESAGGSSY